MNGSITIIIREYIPGILIVEKAQAISSRDTWSNLASRILKNTKIERAY